MNTTNKPLDILDGDSAWNTFITDRKVNSCNECHKNYQLLCPISRKEISRCKHDNISHIACPLKVPDQKIKIGNIIIYGMPKIEWVLRNPILKKGIYTIETDILRNTPIIDFNNAIKIGNGKKKYNDIPYLHLGSIGNVQVINNK